MRYCGVCAAWRRGRDIDDIETADSHAVTAIGERINDSAQPLLDPISFVRLPLIIIA
jgi:uncharacterized protein YjlB